MEMIDKKISRQASKHPLAYAAYSLNEVVREHSSSGGMFTELAEYIINQGGVVFGCGLDSDMKAMHIMSENKKELEKLCGSKYVQSEIGNTYKQCEDLLRQERKVLFTGTPCQVEGLYRYLNCVLDENSMDNLYTQDLICHGVPSPDVWKQYLEVQKLKNHQPQINNVKFRDKSEGWNQFSLALQFAGNMEIKETLDKNVWFAGFLNDLYLRPSCYECKCKKLNRKSDITLADFWGIEHVIPKLSDDKGVSLVIVHSKKGQELLSSIKNNIYIEQVRLEDALAGNPSMTVSVKCNKKKRKTFFRIYPRIKDSVKLEDVILKYSKKSWFYRSYLGTRRLGGKLFRKLGLR